MSDSGLPPTTPPTTTPYPEQPAPPPVPPKRSKAPLLIGLLVLLLVAGGAAFAVVTLTGDDDEKSAITFPKNWDERVLPYVEIAEKERDLDFKHPVEVRFLDEKEFLADRKADEEITDEDRKEIEQTTGLFRAAGLISGDVDLLKAFQDFRDSGTLAYYSPETKKITVRGTEITPATKSTLVHELVHVLQDQHFDIGKRTEEFSKLSDEDKDTTSESSVYDAVVEGDASRIETQYKESLDKKDLEALEKSEEQQSKDAGEAYAKIPEVVVTLNQAPYALGEVLVQAVFEDGGNAAVDKLFTDTPQHEAALLDAFQVLDGDTDAKDVDLPELADGEEKFDSGEFGAMTLFFVLAERIPMREALAAADGWAGDQYVGYDQGGTSCFKIAYVGDTDEDTDTMLGAIQDWIAVAPGKSSTVAKDGDQLVFQSCDPGKNGPKGKDVSDDGLTLVTARTYIGLSVLKEGAPARAAGCLAKGLTQEFTFAELNDEELAKDPAVQEKIKTIGLGCR